MILPWLRKACTTSYSGLPGEGPGEEYVPDPPEVPATIMASVISVIGSTTDPSPSLRLASTPSVTPWAMATRTTLAISNSLSMGTSSCTVLGRRPRQDKSSTGSCRFIRRHDGRPASCDERCRRHGPCPCRRQIHKNITRMGGQASQEKCHMALFQTPLR